MSDEVRVEQYSPYFVRIVLVRHDPADEAPQWEATANRGGTGLRAVGSTPSEALQGLGVHLDAYERSKVG